MADLRRAVELGRTLRSQAGIQVRQPLGRLWLAMPSGWLRGPRRRAADELLALLAEELNVKIVEIIGDESELVDRRVKPLLPVIGKQATAKPSRPSWPRLATMRSSTTTTAR